MRISSTKSNSRYRALTATIALVLTGSVLATPARASREPIVHTCRSADTTSAYLEAIIEGIVSLTDSTSTVVRTALNLPLISASNVSLVTQSQTCGKAASALDAAQNSTNPNRTMYVFTRYAVFEVAGPSSDFSGPGANFIWYFTNKWDYLSSGLI
jgi:D-alanyl-D-alanine carboxypeptidase